MMDPATNIFDYNQGFNQGFKEGYEQGYSDAEARFAEEDTWDGDLEENTL